MEWRNTRCMPTQLNADFEDYIDQLVKRDGKPLASTTKANYKEYAKWIGEYCSKALTIELLSDQAEIERLVDEVRAGFNANPGPNRKHDFNKYRVSDTKTVLKHYREFLQNKATPSVPKAVGKRNPDWIRDELLLALELYLAHRKSPPGKTSREVKALSQELRQLRKQLGTPESATLRNVNGVYLKMMNFRSFDPDYTKQGKKGMERGNSLEEPVWNEFINDITRLNEICALIRQGIYSSTDAAGEFDDAESVFIEEAEEGRLLTRIHVSRERNRELVRSKKESVLRKESKLVCEACGFDFAEKYGERGEGFIECHHNKPVHTLVEGGKTKLADLSLICANCHRMVHSKKPWFSIEQLRAILS